VIASILRHAQTTIADKLINIEFFNRLLKPDFRTRFRAGSPFKPSSFGLSGAVRVAVLHRSTLQKGGCNQSQFGTGFRQPVHFFLALDPSSAIT